MKKYFLYKYITGCLLIIAAAIGFTACDADQNDWTVDDSQAQMFTPVVLEPASLAATSVTLRYSSVPNAGKYVIELSQDSLAFTSIEKTIEIAAEDAVRDSTSTNSRYLLEVKDLESASRYSARIKSVSKDASLPESKWGAITFKTPSEQIMFSVADGDKTSSSVRLSWKAGEAVTKIELLKGGTVALEKALTAGDIAAGEITLTGLEAGTAYLANLYNNTSKRGYAQFSTFPNAPSADVVLYLAETDIIDQVFLDDLATQHPGKSITLALAGNSTYIINEKLTIPDNMSINFFGLPGEKKTVFNLLNNIDYGGNHSFITFQNLDIDCSGKGYVMNQSSAANVGKIEFDDCIVQNVATTFFRMQNATNVKVVSSLVINNCIFRSIGSGYSFIHVDAGSGVGVLKNLTISNSTFDKICLKGKCFIFSNKTDMESITISKCTMYKVSGASNYFIDFGASNGTTGTFSISNTILGLTGDDTVRGVRAKNAIQVDNTYATKDWYQSSNAVSYLSYDGTATDLFENPESGDFKIKDITIGGESQPGDPRWW